MAGPLVVVRSGPVPSWVTRMVDHAEVEGPPEEDRLREASSFWIDGTVDRPLEIARRVHQSDPSLQIGVVAPAEDRAPLERRLIFTPGLGEVWIVEPDDMDLPLLDRAAALTRTRRNYRVTRNRFVASARHMEVGGRARAVVSDAFLATLLQVLPDPVVSVDEDDRVVTWSVASERMSGVARESAIGKPLRESLSVHPPEPLARLLEEARSGTSRAELFLLHRTGAEHLVDAVATPVTAEGIHVRVLVLRDLTGERRTQAELRAAMEIRSRFLASMSHEIRTPINAIMGYNDLLLSGALGHVDEGHVRHLERSQAAARHLLELVNDILDLSKLEAGKIALHIESVRAGELMDELAATFKPLAEQHETVLEQDCSAPTLEFRTDPRRVKQILLNLVSNAVRFGEKRPVTIRCVDAGGQVVFEVEDRGVGIAPEDQERIFEEFTQVGESQGGTGLGLPISRRLAETLGGTLTVESELGTGSTFQLALPGRGPHPGSPEDDTPVEE